MIIGILGDIGSGKTFVSNLLKFPVFNADKEIKNIYKKNKKCYYDLKKCFPKKINNFPIDKKEISEILIKDKNNIKKIGKIIHPYVNKNLKKFLIKNKNKNIVLDIPLLIENKILEGKMFLIFINAKKKDIEKRLLKRTDFNKKIYNIVKKNQLSLSIKRKMSNIIIENNFKKKDLKKKVKEIRGIFKNA